MADLTLAWSNASFGADFLLGAADIATGQDLRTSVIVSLFTEPGWWANSFEADAWGCRLAELRRAKRTQVTLLRARDYCREALQWLLDDSIADQVDVACVWQGSALLVGIVITQGRQTTQFSFVWNEV